MNIPLLMVVALIVLRVLYAASSRFQQLVDGAIRNLRSRVQRFTVTYKIALREAQDPTTPTARLSLLASSPFPEVLQAVAQNPNSPPAVLMTLSETFPEEVLENSALMLILLEDPVFLTRLPERAALYFLASSEVVACWEPLAQHHASAVRCAVAAHPDAPKHLKEALLFDDDMSVRHAARAVLSPEVLRLLLGVGWSSFIDADEEGLADPLLTAAELLQLAELFPMAAKKIALHPNISQELLQRFSTFEDPWVRSHVASHSHTSLTLLEALSSDADESVASSVIRNVKTPESLLERIASQHPRLQKYIPQGRKLSEPFLRKLSQSSDEQVLSSILASLEVPEEIVVALLRILPNYGDSFLHRAMSDPGYHAIVERLSTEDPDPEVRAGLQRSIARWLELQANQASRGWRSTVPRPLSGHAGGILPRVWR